MISSPSKQTAPARGLEARASQSGDVLTQVVNRHPRNSFPRAVSGRVARGFGPVLLLLLAAAHFGGMAGPKANEPCRESPGRIHPRA